MGWTRFCRNPVCSGSLWCWHTHTHAQKLTCIVLLLCVLEREREKKWPSTASHNPWRVPVTSHVNGLLWRRTKRGGRGGRVLGSKIKQQKIHHSTGQRLSLILGDIFYFTGCISMYVLNQPVLTLLHFVISGQFYCVNNWDVFTLCLLNYNHWLIV